jgi:hypothetical protein
MPTPARKIKTAKRMARRLMVIKQDYNSEPTNVEQLNGE